MPQFPPPLRSMDATRTQLWPAGWSRKRRAAVAAFGLFMFYVQSVYFTGFYIPEEEYWFPFWTGMTVGDRLLSLVLALAANVGLIATPFVRAPGRLLRLLLIASLVSGAVVSLSWLTQSLADWANTAIEYPDRFMKILWALAPSTTVFYTIFGSHAYLSLSFVYHLMSIRRSKNLRP
jgi:hypothetical protein